MGATLDPEAVIRFYDSSKKGLVLNLFFNRAFPCILGGICTRKTILLSLAEIDSVFWVGHLLEGFADGVCDVKVLQLSEKELCRRWQTKSDVKDDVRAKFSGFRSLPWCASRHVLYQGVASYFGIGMTDNIQDYIRVPKSLENLGLHFGLWTDEHGHSHALVEVCPQIWGEFFQPSGAFGYQLHYLFKFAGYDNEGHAKFKCVGNEISIRCLKYHGQRCKMMLGSQYVEGHGLDSLGYRYWICTQKLRTLPPNMQRIAVIAFFGTFAPFHKGHLEVLELARKRLEKENYFVCGGFVCPVGGTSTKKDLSKKLSLWKTRAAMVYLALLNHDWASFDGFEGEEKSLLNKRSFNNGKHVTQSIGERVAKFYGKSIDNVDVFWVNGDDAHYDRDFFINLRNCNRKPNVRMCIVPRRGTQASSWDEAVQKDMGQALVVAEKQSMEVSSSSIREHVRNMNIPSVFEEIGNSRTASFFLWICSEESELEDYWNDE